MVALLRPILRSSPWLWLSGGCGCSSLPFPAHSERPRAVLEYARPSVALISHMHASARTHQLRKRTKKRVWEIKRQPMAAFSLPVTTRSVASA